jgi:hypothetical protein
MSEARIDRLLAAAVHQAIADLLPSRLDFYEGYLRPRGWREDAVNLAPVSAVLSFLRHEDDGTYDRVMTLAARYAARWVHQALPWRVRVFARFVPGWVRLRRLTDVARRNLERSYRGTRVRTTVRRRAVTVEVSGSIFCGTRDGGAAPLCRYYVALFEELLVLDGFVLAGSTVNGCRAQHGAVCSFRVVTDGRTTEVAPSSSLSTSDVS